MSPQFCPTCQGIYCCDFCESFDFNGDEDGAYIDKGFCRHQNLPADPGSGCSDFRCRNLFRDEVSA